MSRGFDSITGKRRRVFRTVRGTKADAERALTKLLREIDTGTDLDTERLTVAAYLDRWLPHVQTRVRPRTFERYSGLVRGHIVPRIGGVKLSRLRAAHVQMIIDQMSAAGLAPRSVIHCHRVLGQALRQAVRWQLIATNPAAAAQAPRPSRPDLAIPTPPELVALVKAAKGGPWEMPMLAAVSTGLRRGELLGLRWRDVDLDAARIRVSSSLQRAPGKGATDLRFLDPKTPRARREIAAPPILVDALRRHRAAQAARRLLLGEAWQDLDVVFDAGDGRALDPDSFSNAFRRIAASAGLGRTRLHDVRHGYATALLVGGVHPKIASEALGHSSVAFTLDTYSHVVEGLQEKASEAIQRVLGETTAGKLPGTGAAN
ncbi:MAG: site-specific integrase [Actinomycetota bacterium]